MDSSAQFCLGLEDIKIQGSRLICNSMLLILYGHIKYYICILSKLMPSSRWNKRLLPWAWGASMSSYLQLEVRDSQSCTEYRWWFGSPSLQDLSRSVQATAAKERDLIPLPNVHVRTAKNTLTECTRTYETTATIDRISIRIFSKIGGWNRQIEWGNAKFGGQFT